MNNLIRHPSPTPPPPARTISVVVAEDMNLMRALLVRQFAREADIRIVGEAENGREAVDLAVRLQPDVVLMDLDMPVVNGVQATQRIAAQAPRVRVILLTGHQDLISVGQMAGAVACLNKGCTPAELVAAIRSAAAAGSAHGPAGAAGGGDRGEEVSPALIEQVAARAGLTEREKAVLAKAVDTRYTRAQIAHALSKEWGQPVTDSAVKHAQERIMAKLGVEPRTRATLVKQVLGGAAAGRAVAADEIA